MNGTQEPKIMIRPGLLDRLKTLSGLTNDDAFAGAIGTSRSTLVAVRDGRREPSLGFAVGIAKAFGLGLSEPESNSGDSEDFLQ